MSALTADTTVDLKEPGHPVLPVKDGETLYHHALLCHDAEGLLVPGADSAGLKFAGVGLQSVPEAASATCAVEQRKLFLATGSGFTDADVGKPAYVVDDQTVGLTSTHKVCCGTIAQVVSATQVFVDPAGAIGQVDWTRLAVTAGEVADAAAATSTDGTAAAAVPDALTSTDGTAAAAVPGALTSTDGLAAGLSFSAQVAQAEAEALAAEVEKVGDDVRGVHAAMLLAQAETEKVGDDVRGIHAAMLLAQAETEKVGDDARAALATVAEVVTALKALGLLTDPA